MAKDITIGNVNFIDVEKLKIKEKDQETYAEFIEISPEDQAKIISDNIKSGVTILGNAGKSSVVDTEDGTAIAEDIASGKTAYVNGTKLTGTASVGTGEITGHTATFTEDLASDPYVTLIYLNGTTETIYANGVYSNVVYICVHEHWCFGNPSVYGATLDEFMNGFWLKNDVEFHSWGICLTGDTLITLSDRSVKRIDELQLADDYLSYDLDTGELVKDSGYHLDNRSTRSFAYEKMADRYNKCTFDDGTIIKEVHGHRFFNVTKGEFIYLMFWEIGDQIYKIDGTTPKLIAKETIYKPVPFYSVSTKNHHNGFANGCLYGDRHTQKYEINLVDGKIIQDRNRPTDISMAWRKRKLKEDKAKSWIERGKDE